MKKLLVCLLMVLLFTFVSAKEICISYNSWYIGDIEKNIQSYLNKGWKVKSMSNYSSSQLIVIFTDKE